MVELNVSLWTIDELGVRVAKALASGYDGAPNGRVREVPDRRTIRYYTTLGLIDRPAEMRGRTAFYSQRHLLQLVAIKRLQAQGLSLADVQRTLIGLTADALNQLAALPNATASSAGKSDTKETGASYEDSRTGRATSFWKEVPQPATARRLARPPAAGNVNSAEGDQESNTPTLLQGVRLNAEVTLMVASPRPIDESDLRALRAAAEPLMEVLQKRGLLQRSLGEPGEQA